jgi:hypothetical protein
MNTDEQSPREGATGDAKNAKHTPGPWSWFGNTDTGEVYLATTHRGRIFVLRAELKRRGTLLVQPTNGNSPMKPHTAFVQYEVCKDAGPNRKDPRIYRADFREIDHPDLRLIAAAPDLLAACERALETEWSADAQAHAARVDLRDAIAKARGNS